jgi:hypothetical protein
MGQIQIREAIFESNSSSSHTLAITESDVLDRFFDKQAVRTGIVNIRMDERGDYQNDFRYYLPENILGFLIAGEIEGNENPIEAPDWSAFGFTEYGDFVVATREVDMLPILRGRYPSVEAGLSFLEEFTKLAFSMVIAPGRPLIIDTGDLGYITGILSDTEQLKKLLFNKESYIETTMENGWRHLPVDSDIGIIAA